VEPLTGRDEDVAWLRGIVSAAAMRGDGRAVVVGGAPGIGKSAFVRHAFEAYRNVVTVSFEESAFPVPGYGVRRLAEWLCREGDALPSLLDATARGGPGHERAIWHACDRALRVRSPVTVVLDDAQWADELTLGWLARCEALLRSAPVTIVAVVRDGPGAERVRESLERAAGARPVDTIELGPLATEDVARLVRERGVALEWATPDARELLGWLALVPQPASPRLLQELLGWDPARFGAALDAALATRLMVRRGAEVQVAHALHRAALDALVPEAERPERHRTVAARLATGGARAAEVADQLIRGDRPDEAVGWLLKAVDEAHDAHDYGAELAWLGIAVELSPRADTARAASLAGRAVLAARWSAQPARGEAILDEVLARPLTPPERAEVLIGKARVVSNLGRYADRVDLLHRAVALARDAQDERSMALALGELAFPVGTPMAVAERLRVATEAAAVAERAGDPYVLAVCAGNVAIAEVCAGTSDGMPHWARARSVLEGRRDPLAIDIRTRNTVNQITTSVSAGRYRAADEVVRTTRREPLGGVGAPQIAAQQARMLWATGHWDGALALCAGVVEGYDEAAALVATVIRALVEFERERAPDTTTYEVAAAQLVGDGDIDFVGFAMAALVRLRAARREPRPERGVRALFDDIVTSGLRFGWEDLLAATAEVRPRACLDALARLGDLRPAGPRAAPTLRYVDGLLARADGRHAFATAALEEAAEGFAAIDEPYPAARCLAAAAVAARAAGRRAGSLWVRAAESFRSLGADRSLAAVVRAGGGTRALSAYPVPTTQQRGSAVGLTPREHEVAQLVGRGLTARDIAAALGISDETARNHIRRIRAKFGGVRKSQLVAVLSEPLG
jgi:DNA-binding CsgD family transcriptional regulator/Arc/MetJ-type ribon-helix-helix transcriptional regulator